MIAAAFICRVIQSLDEGTGSLRPAWDLVVPGVSALKGVAKDLAAKFLDRSSVFGVAAVVGRNDSDLLSHSRTPLFSCYFVVVLEYNRDD